MDKKNKIILASIISLTLVIMGICAYSIITRQKITTSDAIKFKKEYELLNGVENNNNNKIYPDVEISSENPIKYKTDFEIIDVLKNETAIIYFGYESCPWCRSVIESLLKAAKDNNISQIYYVNIENIRDKYELENKKVSKTKEGTESYSKILDFFGNKLSKYYLKDENGEKYDTKTTRLYAPTVIAVKDGEILAIHEGTVESQTNPYEILSADQKEELYKIYDELIVSLDDKTCTTSDKNC